MTAARIMANRFLSLSWLGQVEVAQSAGLWRDGDEKKAQDWPKLIFERAREGKLVAQLWDGIEKKHGDGKHPVNPFSEVAT